MEKTIVKIMSCDNCKNSTLTYCQICNPFKNPHAVALGFLGGSKKSAKKTKAVRLNGKKGGRPKIYALNK